ncbi:MAG: zinc metalloprotease HtpX [Alphaproteobacteria bacterium]
MGRMKTFMLMAAMTALLMVVGQYAGGNAGMMMAFLMAGGMNFFAYWNSDKMVLRKTNAQEVDAITAPTLYRMIQDLSQNADLPMPKVYVISSPQPNAFATGRDPQHAAIAVNTGLMDILSQDELAGVISHELAHIKNRDTLTMTVTATMAGALTMVARWAMFMGGNNRDSRGGGALGAILSIFLAPMAAALIQFAVSRAREYEADKHGAWICGNPLWLAGALEKLGIGAQRIRNPNAERYPETASLYIVNPLAAKGDKLFSTHPSLENRIERLREMAEAEPNVQTYQVNEQNQMRQASQQTQRAKVKSDPKDFTAPGNDNPWK